MVVERAACVVWLGVTLTGVCLGVDREVAAGAAVATGAGGVGREATGTAL